MCVCMVVWTFLDVRAHEHLRMYARVQVSGVRVDVSDGRACAAPTRVCAHAHAWMRTRRGEDMCMRGCVHYAVETFALGRIYGLVATHVRIAHGLNFMDYCVI